MALRVSVAGVVEMEVDGAPVDLSRLGRVGRLFFVYLVCERRRPVAKDELADVLWGEDLPRSWEQMLRGNASKLRTVFAAAGLDPTDALRSAFGAYQVVLPPGAFVDVEEAAAALEKSLAATRVRSWNDAQEAATAAVAVAARGFLAGWSRIWVEQRQAELRELRLRGLELVARAASARGRWVEAVAAAEEAVAIEPFRESAYQVLMTAHRGAGNPGEALRAYERCRRVLADQLGVSPSSVTERLYLSLLEDEGSQDEPPLPLPALLATSPAEFLVGRLTDSDRLHAALDRVADHGRQAVLVAGEPGIGKTALVAHFARVAHDGGAQVLYGRCDEELSVAYQPFVEALGHYVSHCPLSDLSAHVSVHGSQIARIAPELLRRLPDAPALDTTAQVDRYRLFEAVADLVDKASQRGPVVLVLDDLHWAAPPTLALLRHVLRSPPLRLLVVGTYRHTEVAGDHPLAATLPDLRREAGVERMLLAGLDEDGVSAFVERIEGRALDPAGRALARALHTRTAGNPFFVGEFLRHLAETAGVYRKDGTWSYYEDAEDRGVPEGVRDVVARRLGRLSPGVNRALTVAAVVGMDFDLHLLELVAGSTDRDATLDALDEAVAADVVIEAGSGRYRFAHALVRDTIYTALTSSRRARLHHQVGDALVSMPGDPSPRLPALAHHFAEAATDGAAVEAGGYALAAARQAFDRSAWEDALAFVQRGLDALPSDEPAPLELRFELLLVEYETWMVVVDLPQAGAALRNAVEAARGTKSPEILARALTLYLLTSGVTDPRGVELAEGLLANLADPAPGLRARLLSGLAFSGHYRDPVTSELTTRDALTLARESGDAEAVYSALVARKAVLADSPHTHEWLAVEEELVAMGPVSRALAGTRWMHSTERGRVTALLTLGDRARFETELDALDQRLRQMRNRGGGWHVALSRAMLALLDGRFAEVQRLAATALDMNRVQVAPWAIQMSKLALEQGRAPEFCDEVARVLTVAPENATLCSMYALMHVESGRPGDALGIVEALGANGFLRIRRGFTATGLAYVAEVVTALREVEWATTTYDAFLAYAGRAVLSGVGAHCPGAVDRYLGQLAATLGKWDESEKHFDAALRLETDLRSPPLLARTRYWYGRMLLERGCPGDADRARHLLKSSVETAELLGMTRLAVQVSALA